MTSAEFIEQLRTELPKLLREHPEVRHEVVGIMLEAFPSREEFAVLLAELRALREDMNRRFEAVDRRFEAVDRRFEAVDRRFEEVIAELRDHGEQLRDHGKQLSDIHRTNRDLNIHMSALGSRVGFGLEGAIREVVEEFAGQTFPFAHRLVLRDDTGEVYGIVGAGVEFDLYVHNEKTAYLVEVKSRLKPEDVFSFQRKLKFAQGKLGQPAIPLVIALVMDAEAERALRDLGIRYRVGVEGEMKVGR